MAKKRAKAAKKKSAKKAPPRPRTPARRNQEPSAVRQGRATGGAAGDVDLADVLRREGISEGRIPEAIALLRSMSDARGNDTAPRGEPVPMPVESAEELNVATAADAILAEAERGRARAKRAIAAGRADQLRGHQGTLWAMELSVLRGPPRSSFVGRAIQTHNSNNKDVANYINIFVTICSANRVLLPENVHVALTIACNGSNSMEPTEKRKQEKAATSTLRKNLDGRVDILAMKMRYVTPVQSKHGTRYRLTRLGSRVFDGWPNWHADDAAEPSTAPAGPPGDDGSA